MMYQNTWNWMQERMLYGMPWATPIMSFVFILMIWSLVWKGMALWKAARQGSTPWFVALLVINTAGILEILYLYVFSKKSRPGQGA